MGDTETNSREGTTVKCICLHYVKYRIYLCRKNNIRPTQQKIDFELMYFLEQIGKRKIWAPFVRILG